MNSPEQKIYMLVIKRDNKDYLPLEWNKIPSYNNENLQSLEGIDELTKRLSHLDLIISAVDENIVSSSERYTTISIIYKEKGHIRELKDGAIFESEKELLDEQYIIESIIDNSTDKDFINYIVNLCRSKEPSQSLQSFAFAMKNIEYFRTKGPNGIRAAVLSITSLPYEEKRHLLVNIGRRLRIIQEKKEDRALVKEAA